MANVSFSVAIPEERVSEVIEALCSQFGYQAVVDGEANPESQFQFANRMVRQFIMGHVKAHKTKQAELAARQQAISSLDFDITDPN